MYQKRWQWWPPREVTDWWKPDLVHANDEYRNPSILFIIPPLGAFIIFTGEIDRSEEALLREERRSQEE